MERKISCIVVIGLLLLTGVASFSVTATNPNDTTDQPQLQIQVFVFGKFLYSGYPGDVDPDSHIIEIPRGSIYWIRVTADGKPIYGAEVRLIRIYNDGTIMGVGNAYYYTKSFGFVRPFITAPSDIHIQENTVFKITVQKEGYTGISYILNFY